jgi:DNA/RNA-binding domain of Phe-tRNA-synthetase-like protein
VNTIEEWQRQLRWHQIDLARIEEQRRLFMKMGVQPPTTAVEALWRRIDEARQQITMIRLHGGN